MFHVIQFQFKSIISSEGWVELYNAITVKDDGTQFAIIASQPQVKVYQEILPEILLKLFSCRVTMVATITLHS